jgi:hypothetical protein
MKRKERAKQCPDDRVQQAMTILQSALSKKDRILAPERDADPGALLIEICMKVVEIVDKNKDKDKLKKKCEELEKRNTELDEKCHLLEHDLQMAISHTVSCTEEKSGLTRRLENLESLLTKQIRIQKKTLTKMTKEVPKKAPLDTKKNALDKKKTPDPAKGLELLSPGFKEEFVATQGQEKTKKRPLSQRAKKPKKA